MDPVFLQLSFIFIFPYVSVFAIGRRNNAGLETYLRNFYKPLAEKYPRSYVRQNKALKVLRKWLKMDTTRYIHWMTCVIHYIHMVVMILPILSLIVFLFVPTPAVIVAFCVGALCLLAFDSFFVWGLFFLQHSRCRKIKKNDPRYSETEFGSPNFMK